MPTQYTFKKVSAVFRCGVKAPGTDSHAFGPWGKALLTNPSRIPGGFVLATVFKIPGRFAFYLFRNLPPVGALTGNAILF
ncbi:hypothetical protein [Pseudoramibacter alactolyticus]|uniref:hypothetical protein n=1 Tax=Pseudoramibacter alactolyticus TaxID=113287 RepID=UPI00248DE3AC|nr:hypothetical protein [Pseudoramibacter alactolyticus]